MKEPRRPVWAEVDLKNVKFNLAQVRNLIAENTEIMAVVKADAYGHGVIPVAEALIEEGVDRLAVALPGEGQELRQAGIDLPVQILGEVLPSQVEALMNYDLIPTLCKRKTAFGLNEIAGGKGKKVKVHIKVDTGMGRIGKRPEEAVDYIKFVSDLPHLEIEGIMTHFARADEHNKDYTYEQWESFKNVLAGVRAAGIEIPLVQVANSAAILDLPEMNLDLVRPGIMLYGLLPSGEIKNKVELKPVLSWKARIVYIKEVPPGSGISYGTTFITERPTEVATIPLGYADGYSRLLSNKGEVLIRGQRAPILGRVCMDQFMVDVTDIPGTAVGDEVVLIGHQGEAEITATELANHIGTINYEVLCGISKRIERIYNK
ncbi:MAG: alanine racemase [Halanaerobiales bacterium]